MATTMTADEILDREFLQIRGKTLELAAAFDRLNRASGDVVTDPRLKRIWEALDALQSPTNDRAEQVQLIFSRSYEDDWREQYGI